MKAVNLNLRLLGKGKKILLPMTLMALMVLAFPLSANAVKVVSEKTVAGFKFPESVAYDQKAKVLYVSEFVSALKPFEKDGMGRISKVSLDGKVLEERFLPAEGGKLNKPKGIWVKGNRLWVTDIDSVWIFNTKNKKGRQVMLPGIKEGTFANDPTVIGKTLYVSDNRGDQLYSVTPANFLSAKVKPKVKVILTGKSVNPNGLYPGPGGSLLMVGFKGGKEPRAIFSLKKGRVKKLSKDIGMLDGIYRGKNGLMLVTDWVSGSLFAWSKKKGMQTLAKDFKGPADFAVFHKGKGLMVVVPDLVKGDLRFVQLGK